MDFESTDFVLEYRFDVDAEHQFSVSIPNHLYIPFNAQMTVWDRRAFMFLYLPISVHGRVSDIWRSYIAQTVMHVIGLHGLREWRLLYCPVLVDQYRNSHNYLADFQSELPLYLQTHELLQFLHEFATTYTLERADEDMLHSATVGRILLDLYIALYEYGILELDDVRGIHGWITDIVHTIGWSPE